MKVSARLFRSMLSISGWLAMKMVANAGDRAAGGGAHLKLRADRFGEPSVKQDLHSSPRLHSFLLALGVAGNEVNEESGAQGRDRTTDTAIFSHVLYQLSYLGAPRAKAAERARP